MPFRVGRLLCVTVGLTLLHACMPVPDTTQPVPADNRGPAALVGDHQVVREGDSVELDGSQSQDPDGDPLIYQWRQVAGPAVVLVNAGTPKALFDAPEVSSSADLAFQLVVEDVLGLRSAARTSVTVLSTNVPIPLLVEELDDMTVGSGEAVTLTGSAQGGVGQLTYLWQQTAGEDVELADANTLAATFTAPVVDNTAALTFELTVTDEIGQSVKRSMNVEVLAQFVVLAGDDQLTVPGFEVALQGSSVGGTGTVAYEWRQTEGPNVVLSDPNDPNATFTAPLLEEDTTLTFELRAVDEENHSNTDTVDVRVDAPVVRFSTTMGEFKILLRPDVAPLGVANFARYVDEEFYVGLIMHRIIPDFVVQGGGWYPDLSQTLRYDPIPIESNNGLSNVRGSVAYARTADPDSATTEFFINLVDNTAEGEAQFGYTNLDYINEQNPGYAVFGRVIEGMEVIDAMAKVETETQTAPWDPFPEFDDVPVEPIVINSAILE